MKREDIVIHYRNLARLAHGQVGNFYRYMVAGRNFLFKLSLMQFLFQ
jgi:hypothetical protein